MKKRLRLIITAFSISFIIMAGLSFYSLRQFSTLVEYTIQVDHTNQVITQLYSIESTMKEMDVKERGFMITRDSVYVEELLSHYRRMIPSTDTLMALLKNDSVQRRSLIMLRYELALRLENIRDNLNYLDTARETALSPYYFTGRDMRMRCLQYLNEMRSREKNILQEKAGIRKKHEDIAYSAIQYLLFVFGVITIALFVAMIRELKGRLIFQDELQNKIADLNRSHEELEQIAFAVSHDLQEPLRKIQIFSNRLLWLRKDDIDPESKATLERINSSAGRMHELIDDLVNLTSLVKEENLEEVNLNITLKLVMHDLQEKIALTGADIHTEPLPVITGHSKQIQLLFRSLLDNAIKFSKENVSPVISVRSDRVDGMELKDINPVLAKQYFYRITIADNGIGFDNKFINKMFKVFQRLHNKESEYDGKGIGLAISQRIMVNHHGYILAFGQPEIGASFRIYFPMEA